MKIKERETFVSIIRGTILYLAIVFSIFPVMLKVYNSMPFTPYGEYFSTIYGDNMNIFVKWIMPFIMGGLLFGLYYIYATKIVYPQINRNMIYFKKVISMQSFRNRIDVVFAILSILLGIVNFIFMYNPLYEATIGVLIKEIFVLVAITALFLSLAIGLEKRLWPILFSTLILPSVLLVLFV